MSDGSGPDVEKRLVESGTALAVLGVVFVAAVVGCASIGEGGAVVGRVAAVVDVALMSLWMPAVYLVGAWGYGRMLWKGDGEMAWVARLGVGVAAMLSVTHLMGICGVLTPMSAWGVTGVGLMCVAWGLLRDRDMIEGAVRGWSVELIALVYGCVCVGAVGLMVVAASQPAGVLWGSEYGGYDSLSYHLELPRVWMEEGRVWPVDWNVYSFLPGYVEAAYVHMELLAGGGKTGLGLAGDGGRGIYAAQYLSVLLTVLAAMVSGSVGQRVCRVIGVAGFADIAGWIAGGLVLTTPWMVVVGTISYNESAVVLLTMCGIGIALCTEWSVMRRVVGAAVVMGVACCCKPTALFLACPMVGVVVLSLVPIKVWWRVCLVGGVVGVVVLFPWLVRNELASGNPVFPMMSGVFGEGHWDARQHAVYSGAHSFDGSWVERLKMLVVPDGEGTTHVSRYRGLTNMQWGVTAGMGLLGLFVLVLGKKTRKAGVVCVVGVGLVLVAWMGLTHMQSRFLVPMVGVFGVLGGIGIGVIAAWVSKKLALDFAALVLVISVLMPVVLFAHQAGDRPNGLLVAGVGAFTGEVEGFDEVLWWGGVNRVTGTLGGTLGGDGKAVYLVGDATAAYVRSPVVYNTTYDGWLIGELMGESPNDPAAWNRGLVERGIGWVVINLSEIDRLGVSGWGDPDVTVDSMIEWAGTLGDPVMVWGGGSRVMFRVSSGDGQSADEVD